jgi:beta-glucosidase
VTSAEAQPIAIALGDLPSAGLPELVYSDGPNGVRGAVGATAFPSGPALAASFDPDLAERFGEAMAREALAAGRNAMLAPGLDIARVPWAGRIGESLGEDPLLAGELGGRVAAALQRNGVLAIPKHFVANNFEHLRTGRGGLSRRSPAIDVRVSRRALLEIYAEPFRRALVNYDAAGFLSSYNRIDGEYVSERGDVLGIPRDEWGWRGLIVPDFIFAVRDDRAALLAGLHLPALGGPAGRTREMVEAAPPELISRLADDVAHAVSRVGVQPAAESTEPLDDRASQDLAQSIAEAGAVLLKNTGGLLPLDPADVSSLALPGIADPSHLLVMGGSAAVTITPGRVQTLAAALADLVGDGKVEVVGGTLGDVPLPPMVGAVTGRVRDDVKWLETDVELPEFTLLDPPAGTGDEWSATLTADYTPQVSGDHRLALTFAGQARLSIDGVEVAAGSREASPMVAGPEYPLQAVAVFEFGRTVRLEVEFSTGAGITIPPLGIRPGLSLGLLEPDDSFSDAVEAARASDVAIVVVGRVSGEAMDVDSLRLPGDQERLIEAVAAANPRTIVVVVAGATVVMEEWRHDVAAIVLAWYAGMEGGAALADVLLGTSEPGGRLPFTIPQDEDFLPPFDRTATSVTYDRWHGQRLLDREGRQAAYPLGFGLSYTSFVIDDVQVSHDRAADAIDVRAVVENAGARPGGHVVQVYASRPEPGDRFLVGFARVQLDAGQRAPVTIRVPLERLASWRGPGRWGLIPGTYRFDVGASAADPASVSTTLDLPGPDGTR